MIRSRSSKAVVNTIASFAFEFVSLICGLILPRLILTAFGSSYNGVTSSITQFISCISLMKAGIGGVTRAALYKPLAEKDSKAISEIVVSTERFLRRVALIFAIATLFFASIYPIWICTDFPWLFSFTLILIISISTFVQYYFGMTYQMLLNADQRQVVVSVVQILSVVFNTLLAAFLIKFGASIHIVKLGSAVAFALNPLIICFYTRKKYKIDRSVQPSNDRLKQRWDALGHEIANFANNNTDIMVLTIFLGVKEVSVYTIYTYVTNAVHKVVTNFVNSFGAAFGNMYARKQYELMHENLGIFELVLFSITSLVYSVSLVMITPFVQIYTHGVTDVNYYRPIFGILITLASAFTCFRIPYYTITTALGRYKETRNGAIFEALLNIVLSILLVIKLGIIGVAIGTLAAALFRSCQYAMYLSKYILKRSILKFVLHFFVSVLIMLIVYLIGYFIMPDISNIVEWIIKSIIFTVISITIIIVSDLILWKNDTRKFLKKIGGVLNKK